jgi:lipopolysaccharide transport system permease protein
VRLLAGAVAPVRLLLEHRGLILAFVRRDVRGRYASSVLGLSWAVIQPLALLAVYTFIFSTILQVRFGAASGPGSFAAYLLCGMLPWLAFAEGVSRSAGVVLEHAHLLKKVVFPAEVLPVFVVLSALLMELVGLGALLVATAGLGGLGWPVLLLPVILLLQTLLTLGLGWFLASVNVFLRDVGQLLGLALSLGMFLTPIVYPPEMLPPGFRWLLLVNPMAFLVEAYRAVVLEARLPPLRPVLLLAATALAAFLAGYWFFRRAKRAFVDVL